MPRNKQSHDDRIEAIRDFNRFYLARMGFLNRDWSSTLTFTEARVMYEIHVRPSVTAKDIAQLIDIDNGQLSRVLSKFERNGYITRKKLPRDARQMLVTLTAKGRKVYDAWSKIARQNAFSVIENMGEDDQQAMLAAMEVILRVIKAADIRHPRQLAIINANATI